MLNPRRSSTKKREEIPGADLDNEIQLDKPVITKKRGRKTVVGEFDIEQEGLKVEREREPSFLKGEADRLSILKGAGDPPSLNKADGTLENPRTSQKSKLTYDDEEEAKTISPNRTSEKNSPKKQESESEKLPNLKMEPIGRASRGLKKLFDDSDDEDSDLFKPKKKK
jgi:hypothetical protein